MDLKKKTIIDEFKKKKKNLMDDLSKRLLKLECNANHSMKIKYLKWVVEKILSTT